jgi:hypothetical protein
MIAVYGARLKKRIAIVPVIPYVLWTRPFDYRPTWDYFANRGAAIAEALRLVLFCSSRYSERTERHRLSELMKFKLIIYFLALTILPGFETMVAQGNPETKPENREGPQYSMQGSVASAAVPPQGAVSYASVTQLNGLLGQLEATTKLTQADLTKLRIERWKTDGSSKKQALADVDSVQRNLQNALPEMIGQLRNSPEDLAATFRLYRNLDALYSVLGGVVESAGAFGPKDDFQTVSNDLSGFESARKQLAERLENLAGSKEQEIVRLRTDLKTAQAAIPVTPPKKIVIDDTEPAKKPVVKKKPAPKKPAGAPAPGATTTPATQTPPPPPKPQ